MLGSFDDVLDMAVVYRHAAGDKQAQNSGKYASCVVEKCHNFGFLLLIYTFSLA